MAEKKPVYTTIGQGVYTITEAQSLTGVPRQRISRWTRGYSYAGPGGRRHVLPPLIGRPTDRQTISPDRSDHAAVGYIITFADLIEVRFLNAFRVHGVSATALRLASQRAQELIGRTHPFSTSTFRTDGVTILAEVTKDSGDKILLDLIKKQYAFEKVISRYLYDELDFNPSAAPERWWPLGREKSVVIDPQRSFGAPIGVCSGIRTQVLNRAARVENSIEVVARIFGVQIDEVSDAVTFETKLAA